MSTFVPQALLSKVTDEKKKNDHLKKMVGMRDKEHCYIVLFFCSGQLRMFCLIYINQVRLKSFHITQIKVNIDADILILI